MINILIFYINLFIIAYLRYIESIVFLKNSKFLKKVFDRKRNVSYSKYDNIYNFFICNVIQERKINFYFLNEIYKISHQDKFKHIYYDLQG